MSPEPRPVARVGPLNKSDVSRSWLSQLVDREMTGADPYEDRGLSIGIIVGGVLVGSFLVAHQVRSTGFLTAAFGTLEMLLLYGTLLFWIVTSALIVVGQKGLSRALDLGGLFFAAGALAWLFVVFPFDLTHVADVLPEPLRILLQWISGDIARVLTVLGFVVHLGLALFSVTIRVSVHRTRARTPS